MKIDLINKYLKNRVEIIKTNPDKIKDKRDKEFYKDMLDYSRDNDKEEKERHKWFKKITGDKNAKSEGWRK